MTGAVEHIAVDPKLWMTLAGADMAEYFTVAQSRSIWLQVRPAVSDALIAVENFNGDIRESICSRAPWEHRLRQLLELDDPCF
jgi:hypothetical protein